MIRFTRWFLALSILMVTVLPIAAQQSSETETLLLQPVDGSMSPEFVMRQRPFVMPDHPTPAFAFDAITNTPVTSADARIGLERFLRQRQLPANRLEFALAQFDDPALQNIIPAPNLRAALLMLFDWDPYQITIDAILGGENESGFPFEAVDFRPFDFGSAIATLQIAYSTGRPRLLVSDRYQNEPPEQLIPILVHESLHNGVDNSFEEETIASLLDCLAYAEILAIDPSAANSGTKLAAYNNIQLFALMNSIGRQGAGEIGIETSFDGDVYLGPGLEAFDADSIRAGIASDPWYAQLPQDGSKGGAVLTALLGRFPESSALGSLDRFSGDALVVIDRGIGSILTPRYARDLAIELQLSLSTEDRLVVRNGGAKPSVDNFTSRPFLPANPAFFDLRAMQPAPAPFDTEFSRAILRESLVRAGLPTTDISAVLTEFDNPGTIELVPDPTLRAGLLILRHDEHWSSVATSLLGDSNLHARPVHIAFRELPNATPAVWDDQGWRGSPVIWIHSMLKGESPALLATAIVEGAFLESSNRSGAQTIIAAAISSVLWADLLDTDPGLHQSSTWGTITRNRDLLALLNSQPFDPGTPSSMAIGLRLGTGASDVLPGLSMNPASFAAYIRASPRFADNDLSISTKTPPILTEFLRQTGMAQTHDEHPSVDDVLLAQIDQTLTHLLPVGMAVTIAADLDLMIAISS